MMNISLCKFCSKNFDCNFNEGKCVICNDTYERFNDSLTSNFPSLLKGIKVKNARYFSISTLIPEKFFLNEEKVFDFCLGNSIKNSLNSFLRSFVESNSHLKYSINNSDVRFVFDFSEPFRITHHPDDLFIFGAYKKLVPGISQKIWKKYAVSVESLIGEKSLEFFEADSYTLHASGREDVDAINTGFRPFVLELKSALKRPTHSEIKHFEKELNKLNSGKLEVILYGRVKRSFVTLVSDSHFDKEYRAYVSFPEKYSEEFVLSRLKEVESFFKETTINQKTPIRVLRRRADITRKRKVYSIKADRDEKGVYLDVSSEAGLYIKELISGDNGRTSPSISETTGIDLKCSFLIVKNINYSFLNLMFENAWIKY